jgi:hypothetical protein
MGQDRLGRPRRRLMLAAKCPALRRRRRIRRRRRRRRRRTARHRRGGPSDGRRGFGTAPNCLSSAAEDCHCRSRDGRTTAAVCFAIGDSSVILKDDIVCSLFPTNTIQIPFIILRSICL